MRRWLCGMQVGALVAVLCSGVAAASMTAPLDGSFAPQSFDFSAQLFARIFDEASESRASFDASYDTSLRGLAFTMKSATPAAPTQHVAAALAAPTITIPDPSFAAPLPAKQISLAQLSSTQMRAPAVGYYASALPAPTDAPATRRFDLTDLQMNTAELNGFTAAALAAGATNVQSTGAYVPIRMGKVEFAPHAEAGQSNALQSNTTDSAVGAGATLNVRAGARNVGLDLSSALEHVTLTAPQFSTGASAPSLSGAQLPMFVPAYADVSAQTISTGVTVPVTRKLTASVQYDTQHLLGAYGVSGASNLDANNTIYGAQLTYNLKGWSAISLSTRQYHFQDNLLPSNALTQVNTNLNFTIKF
ncbi:MAG: hypothetical protein WBD74_01160 [Candidatus Aquilonibacter sp.]